MAKNRPIDTKGNKGFKGNWLFLLLTYSCVLLVFWRIHALF
jgi:hypothetical protein